MEMCDNSLLPQSKSSFFPPTKGNRENHNMRIACTFSTVKPQSHLCYWPFSFLRKLKLNTNNFARYWTLLNAHLKAQLDSRSHYFIAGSHCKMLLQQQSKKKTHPWLHHVVCTPCWSFLLPKSRRLKQRKHKVKIKNLTYLCYSLPCTIIIILAFQGRNCKRTMMCSVQQ